ncbi:MAG: DUF421 domain-containing protein, partial [Clostridia bacterium]|nr:DUF421 domain-containing protein [Clostridia bacterium]
CVPMADVSIPLLYGIVAITCLFILHQILSLLEQKGMLFKRIISGRPSIVINKEGVDVTELKRNNMGVDDLIESMRAAGYFSFDDLFYAIYESNGKLSAFENPNKTDGNSLPFLIISSGNLHNKNVTLINEEPVNILNYLKNMKTKLKNVEVMTVDGNGRVYFKEKNQKYKILSFPLKEGVKW